MKQKTIRRYLPLLKCYRSLRKLAAKGWHGLKRLLSILSVLNPGRLMKRDRKSVV